MKRLWHPRYVSPNSASVIIPVINKSATPRTILDRTGLHSVMLSFLRLSNQIVESSLRRRGNLTSLVTSAKQSPYPCSEPPTNYRKYVLNFLSFWQIDNGFFLTIKHVHSTTSIYTKYTTYIIIITTRKNKGTVTTITKIGHKIFWILILTITAKQLKLFPFTSLIDNFSISYVSSLTGEHNWLYFKKV